MNTDLHAEEQANSRIRFPCGLEQPEGSFRFSMDALLLAAFASCATLEPKGVFVDLGTGCGVVAFALLLLMPHKTSERFQDEKALFVQPTAPCPAPWQGVGLDLDAELIASAQRNAVCLGLDSRYAPVQVDLTDTQTLRTLRRQYGAADLVLANPPWRLENAGRTPASLSRRRALFGNSDTLRHFSHAASVLGATTARFVCVFGAYRLPDMLRALDETGFRPARLRFVHKQIGSPANLCLLESRRTACILNVEPPLILYDADHNPTASSRTFCPFLGFNPQSVPQRNF